MTKKETSLDKTADLRKQAEKIARKKSAKSPVENLETISPKEIRQTLHELRVHQVELDMQNEELRSAHAEIETSRSRYFDLYDLAPVGYVTISENGFLLEANLTIATLLGEARSKLVKKLLFRFVLKEDQHIYFLQLKQIFETGEPQVCELRMVKKDGATFWAQLDMIAAQDADGAPTCRIIISNITERKQVEAHRNQQLVFAKALNEIAETIISKDNSEDILENSNRIIGETLQLDRALIYDVSFEKNILTGLCEWLKLKHPDIAPTKNVYPLDVFLSPFTEIEKTHKYLESQFNAVNAHFIKDGSGKILHEQMNIKSLIWYPFAFDEHGYYVFTLNQILEQRQWTQEEIVFLESAAKQVSFALIKIKLLAETKHAEEALQKANDELEQRVAERTKTLWESEEQYRLVANNIPDIIYSLNSEGNVVTVNSSAFERYGYSEQAAKGKPFLDFVHPEDREILINSFLKAIEDKRKVTTGLQFRIVAENGLCHWFELNAHARFDSNDCYTGEDGVLRDITVRKQAEEALRESEERFSILSNATWEGIIIHKEGIILDANESALKMYGYPAEEVIGKNVIDFLEPQSTAPTLQKLREGKTHNQLYLELNVLRKDKTILSAEALGRPIRYKNLDARVIAIRDITERKQAEKELRESEGKYRLLADHMKDSIWLMDMDLKIKYVSPSVEKLRGYTLEEIAQLPMDKNLTPASYQQAMDFFSNEMPKAIADQTYYSTQSVELEYICKDGSTYWSENRFSTIRDKNGKPISILGEGRNITDRKLAEEALRENVQRNKAILHTAMDGFWRVDMQGRLLEVNETYSLMSGYSEQELLTMCIPDLEVIETEQETATHIETIIAQGSDRFESRHRRKEGTIYDIETSAQYQPANGGHIVAFLRDITARKQAEAEKEKLEAQNRQLQKSESLGRMAASIAHHFNNQLGAVIGNLEMAMDELPKGASTHQTLTKAMQSAWTAADMSGLMLTYLGQTHDKRESLDLSYSCRKILPLIETTLPGNVVMETDFPLPRPIIMANVGEIQQILTNLLTNAWEAVGKNSGTISLSVKTVSPAEITTVPRHPIDWQPQGKSYACLEVTDTGCGIEDKAIEQLFDPFFTDKFTGRGMGLPVVLGIVKAYKGAITLESKPGSGSTFRIFFPVSEEAPRQPQTTENDRDVTISAPAPRKMEEGGTVLVVEDEEPLRKMAAIMLERLGFIVLEAKDGIEALDVFGKHQSEIRFVLTDLTMPRMNGLETLTALRKLQPDIPVILASGYDKAHVMSGDHPELPQAFLAKPYNLKALRAAISQALENRKK